MPDEYSELIRELRHSISKELSKSDFLDIAFGATKGLFRLFSYFAVVIAACCLIDYLSLCKTWLIVRMCKHTRQWKRAYTLDICITLLLSLGWAVFWGVTSYGYKRVFGIEKLEYNPLPYIANGLISAWIPTYLLASFLTLSVIAKLVAKFMIPAELLKSRLLAIDEKPFQSIGVIASIVLLPITTAYVTLIG